ncbi:MAG: HAMP domain-containing histidine kinase [Hyphomonadaceae bacterium]|nr:HAMP domain-containing histidine kinase [Hyphomonadaceae bacterium]
MAAAFWESAAPAHASPRDADAMSRRGFSFRLAFALLAGLAASLVTPVAWLLVWLALVTVWELWLAPFLTNRLVWPVYDRDPKQASLRQAGVVAFGAALFGAFPFLVWQSGTTLGAILAIAWAGGTAIHVFVYLANHRRLLILGLIPPLAAALILPVIQLGVSLEALSASLALLYLISAAAIFAFDRNTLLVNITKEKAAREAAETLARAKGHFLHAVTHELRTPINHIIGYAGLLEEDIRAGSADSQDAANVAAAGSSLLRMVNRVIEISKLDAGAIDLDPHDIEIGALLSAAATSIAAAASKSGNQVVVDTELASETINADSERVLECLACLAENAAKFCTNGVITFSARRLTDGVELAVADTGPGLNEAERQRIFEPMSQADGSTTRAHDGLGLGLTLARAIARALGSKLSMESTLGKGTRVALCLPRSSQAQNRGAA